MGINRLLENYFFRRLRNVFQKNIFSSFTEIKAISDNFSLLRKSLDDSSIIANLRDERIVGYLRKLGRSFIWLRDYLETGEYNSPIQNKVSTFLSSSNIIERLENII